MKTVIICDPNTWARRGLNELIDHTLPLTPLLSVVNTDDPNDLMEYKLFSVGILCTDTLFTPAGQSWLIALARMRNVTLIHFRYSARTSLVTFVGKLLGCRVVSIKVSSIKTAQEQLGYWLSTPHAGYEPDVLTPNEFQMLALILAGSPASKLSRKLNVNNKTLSYYKTSALKKLQVTHVNQLHYLYGIALLHTVKQ